MLIIVNLYQLSIMSAFFNYLRALGALFIPPKIYPELTVFNSISSVSVMKDEGHLSFFVGLYHSIYVLWLYIALCWHPISFLLSKKPDVTPGQCCQTSWVSDACASNIASVTYRSLVNQKIISRLGLKMLKILIILHSLHMSIYI